MDPLSAFGVAVNVIQLVDYSSRLVSGARQIHHSFDGELEEHTELKLVTDDLSKLAQILNASIESQEAGETLRPHENDEEILDHQRKRLEQQKRIALDTQRLATELLSTLNKLKSGSSNKTWNSIRQALLTIWRRDKIEGLERRLDRLRQEMVTNMVSSIQYCYEYNLRWAMLIARVETKFETKTSDCKLISTPSRTTHNPLNKPF